MRTTKLKVSLEAFIRAGELLDLAFPDTAPTPDHLSHECELAERALDGLIAKRASTRDLVLSRLFAVPHVDNPGCDPGFGGSCNARRGPTVEVTDL